MFIKNNDVELCQTWVSIGSGGEIGKCTVIVELVMGDSVRVTGDSSDPAIIEATRSGFVGHIISDNLTI